MTEENRVVTEKEIKQTRSFYTKIAVGMAIAMLGSVYITKQIMEGFTDILVQKIDRTMLEKQSNFYEEPEANFIARSVVNLEGIAYGYHENYVAPVVTEHWDQYGTRTGPTLSRYIIPFENQEGKRVTLEVVDSKDPRVLKETIDDNIKGFCTITAKAEKVSPDRYKAFASDVNVKECDEVYVRLLQRI
jgi:hypothetical protein